MAVTYRRRKQAVPYRTRLTGRLISCNEGFDADRIGPLTNFGPAVIPDSCWARPGMTAKSYATISCNTAISASGAVTFGA